MKKLTATLLAVVLLCSLLAGCGNRNMEDGTVAGPSGSPIISPSMTPDLEDGIVDDRDGLIGDEEDRTGAAGDTLGNDTGILDGGSSAAGTGSAPASASPSPSAKTAR